MVAITLKTLVPIFGVLSQLVAPAEARLKIVNTKQAPLTFWSGWGAKKGDRTAWDSTSDRKFSFEQAGGPIAECEIITVGNKQGDVTMEIYAVGKYYWMTRCGCEDGWRLDCKMRESRERLLCEERGVRPDQC